MRFLTVLLAVLLIGVFGLGCGGNIKDFQESLKPIQATPQVDETGIVIKSRALFNISTGSGSASSLAASALSSNQTITVTNSPSSNLTVDNSLFSVPAISSTLLDFGFLSISALKDNNLKVCGAGGNQKCTTAFIRMYTTGTTGAGLYNTVDGYGAPITAGQSTLAVVGLGTAGAATMQSFTITSPKNVINLSDFTNPKYNVKIDFSNAGAGSYSSTLVVEYGLAP